MNKGALVISIVAISISALTLLATVASFVCKKIYIESDYE